MSPHSVSEGTQEGGAAEITHDALQPQEDMTQPLSIEESADSPK